MTKEEILDIVDKNSSEGDWIVEDKYYIRHRETKECPICFAGSVLGKNPEKYRESYWFIIPRLNSTEEQIEEILIAADGVPGAKLTTALRKACKLF